MKDVVAYAGGPEREPFNPREHLMDIKNKNGKTEYLPVQWRLVWFREQCPNGTIETEAVLIDLDKETEEESYAWNNETRRSEKVIKRANGIAIFRAVVKDGKGGIGTGTKSEKAASFPDFIEKAETGSIGRALAALGYGTQFVGDEFDENPRIVDAPVERTPHTSTEQEKQAYQQRKPFVEGTVVKEEKKSQQESSPAMSKKQYAPPPWEWINDQTVHALKTTTAKIKEAVYNPEKDGDIPDDVLRARCHKEILRRLQPAQQAS